MEWMTAMHSAGVVLSCTALVLFGFTYGVYLCRIRTNNPTEEDNTWQASKPGNP